MGSGNNNLLINIIVSCSPDDIMNNTNCKVKKRQSSNHTCKGDYSLMMSCFLV